MSDPLPRQDHDSPWKEALEWRFPEFMALLFPGIYPEIDWSKGHSFLDKELQQITADADNGRRYADKLAKVYTYDGLETWVLIHVEVQGEPEADFAARMYTYHYRLLDRYGVDVVSLAVLADASPGFRPQRFQRGRWGCEVDFRFPVAKLLDLDARWAELEASDNVFALVVMAQLKAKQLDDGHELKRWKAHLTRLMYQRGYAKQQIIELFRLIDWMMRLPDALEREFLDEHYAFEEAQHMPYVTSAERFGIEKGRQEGRQEGELLLLTRQITLKFGELPAWARERLERATTDQLEAWAERILSADSLEALLKE
ncbi:DUF4351 domain-containing protein [Halomonas sp. M5N1S17]|uniref:DUF4351 domain-containing protein n=1 Tax=Halomonas alkalisoli TaxID=2907158 RepID=UPI001F3550AC|nr:DUF4351 domain-containing protein [Halomonas alkalisoli]MCE9662550.1 DUF4351 domain-containing protein [Halomonas alkalisoli]